jgi:glycerol-3-phosphate dehydrogenase
MLNGVEFRANTKIVSGVFKDGIWQLSCEDGSVIEAKYVVNAAGLFADEVSKACGAEEFTIRPRKGEEYLLDRSSDARPDKVIFPVPSKNSKGVLVIPTPGGTTMIGPTADMVDDKEDVSTTGEHFDKILAMTRNMVKGVERRDVINAFAGLRPAIEGDDFYIAPSEKVPNFIQAAGIQSPGLTASPAIGVYIKDLLKKCGLILTEKSDIIYENPPHPEVRSLSDDQISELAQKDPAYTRIICRCEQITEAEIIDAVKCGHTTVDGVKFHTRAGMGRCQGGFCSAKILEIISRESGIPMQELTKRGGNSRIIEGKLGSLEVKL